MNRASMKKFFNRKSFWPVVYAIYLTLILLSIHVFIGERSIEDIRDNMDEKYTYYLVFPTDGNITHYDVTLNNNSIPGKITLTYWTEDNKLDITRLENIKTLKIDVQSMFEDESMKVFKKTTSEMPNLHMDYWLEAGDGILTIEFDIAQSEPLENLTFTKFPAPKSVLVNNQEWWTTGTNYVKSGNEITISNIPTGKTTVIMYFKDVNKLPIAKFTTNPANYAGVNESITFNGSASNDPDGNIISWVWNFGDNLTDSGQTVSHNYSTPGNYTIRLTVRDDAVPLGESWMEKNITVSFGAEEPRELPTMTMPVEAGEVAEGTLSDDSGNTLANIKASGNGTLVVKSSSDKVISQLKEDKPKGTEFIGVFLEITLDELDWIYIEVPYKDSDIPPGVLEESLKLYYYNITHGEWMVCENSSVDTVNNILSANVTHLTVFAAMGKETAKEEEEQPDIMGFAGIIVVVIIVMVLLVIIMVVFRSKKTKQKIRDEKQDKKRTEKAIAEWEEKIAEAKELGLPTGDLKKLLKEAKEGAPIEVKPVTKKKGRVKSKVKSKVRSKNYK